MKLLFDENLSPKLPRLLAAVFPGGTHLRDCGLKGRSDDEEVWAHARDHGLTIVSKDGDFFQRSLLHGAPPKLVWLRVGNCTRDEIIQLLTANEQHLRALEFSPHQSVLVLSRA